MYLVNAWFAKRNAVAVKSEVHAFGPQQAIEYAFPEEPRWLPERSVSNLLYGTLDHR